MLYPCCPRSLSIGFPTIYKGACPPTIRVAPQAQVLNTHIYSIVKKLPKEERYSLIDQMRRSAISIPSNIAEGKSRNSINEYRHFVGIAKGSAAELETQLLICVQIGYLSKEDIKEVLGLLDEVSKMLAKLNLALTPRT